MPTIKLALLGGNEAQLDTADGGWVLTILGATELRRPTLAARIRRRLLEERAGVRRPGRRTWVVTVVGMTTVQTPSLASELVELAQLRDAGIASAQDIHRLGQDLLAQEQGRGALSICSVLGTAAHPQRSDDAEREAVHAAVVSGLLPARCRQLVRGTEGIGAQARTLALSMTFPNLSIAPSPYRNALPERPHEGLPEDASTGPTSPPIRAHGDPVGEGS